MSSRSSSPLSSAQDLSDPEMDFVQPSKSTKTTNSPDRRSKPSPTPSLEASPPPNKRRKVVDPRDPLPQDNPRYAFIVAFQAKFNQVFRGVPNLGPQDIEVGVAETPISDQIEALLCKLLGLALNRQKQVEKGHYGRALEEAVSTYFDEWPSEWEGRNPLEGGKTFNQMSVDERLVMLQTLILWVLRHSRVVGDIVKEIYKPGRKTDDSNIPLAVHCWGMDREKKKYYLIEGKDDTYFRVYQEYISPGYRTSTWVSVAGTIDELRDFAHRLGQEGSRNAKELQGKVLAAIPRFEEGEQKRKRREYRTARRAAFMNPGVSMYEGRTRGNKAKYTFDSDEEGGYTSGRATRNSRRVSPVEGPYVTGSGRVTRRTNQYAFGTESNEASTPYAGSESGGSTRRSGRTSLKRGRGEYEPEAERLEDEGSQDDGNSGDDGDDYRDELAEEMDDGDLSDASEEGLGDRSLVTTLKFKAEESKAALAKFGENEADKTLVEDAVDVERGLPKKDESAMDIDKANEDEDDDDVDLVPSSPAQPKVITAEGQSGAPDGQGEHMVVNFLSKGSNSSPASSNSH
ncbi:hypothetical protein H072_8675 [Dactylellina haptotyla CBS 200.50]|uniref:WHIM1 domain-containing protein n=1 Tax=Dactylellina haptotyla (strain CBS 200.50) TaxID=1284197 RepID=S8A3L1_DACHA|nr:hypothetical protein H072_8675 [Dactylellina haptotyla CBS 200.50]